MASMRREDDVDSDDAPEEFTSLQGSQQYQEITKAQQLSIASARRQVKERRKKWAQRLTPRSKPLPPQTDDDNLSHSQLNSGMLPDDILTLLAARQKKVFLSDSEEDRPQKKPKRKKNNVNISGIETVILKELPPAHCVQSSLEFLKKRKMQTPRSSAILNNSNQALRLLSSSGILK